MANRNASYPSGRGQAPQLSKGAWDFLPEDLDVYTYDEDPLVHFVAPRDRSSVTMIRAAERDYEGREEF
jgi:hypothetical protein